MGFVITADIIKLVQSSSQDGSMSHRSLVQCLNASSVGDRRNRVALPQYVRDDVTITLPPQPNRNLLNWDRVDLPMNPITTLPDTVKQFVDGTMSTAEFTTFLQLNNIPRIPELDQLIRSHDADNSATFQDFARLLLWMGVEEMMTPALMAAPNIISGRSPSCKPLNPARARKNTRYASVSSILCPCCA